MGAEREIASECAAGEEDREPEDDEHDLRHEVENGDGEAEAVELRATEEADRGYGGLDSTCRDHVAWAPGDRVDGERDPEIVGNEERRERNHDQVVEEEHPTGEETGEV